MKDRLYLPLLLLWLLLWACIPFGIPTPTNKSVSTRTSISTWAPTSTTTPTSAPTTGGIKGRVIDSSSGSPIPFANINTDPPTSSVTADVQGRYSIPEVPSGNYMVTAVKSGYASTNVKISVVAGRTTTADLHLVTVPTGAPMTESTAEDLRRGIVAYWSFDTCDGTDSSGNGYHGTVYGSPECVDGVAGKALKLDGVDDYIGIPDATNLHGMAELTIEAWVKFNELPAGRWQFIVAKARAGGLGTNSYAIWFAGDTMRIQGAIESVGQLSTLSAPDIIIPSCFYYVALTYNGSTFNLYLDGELKDSVAFSGSIRNTSVPLLIGRRSGKGVDGHGDGVIGVTDEVRLYSRALTDIEIRTLFNAGSERKCSLKVGG